MNLSIGENIRRWRLDKGLTQEEVAFHLGISAQSVSKWERAECYPDIEMLPVLAEYFGISIDELLGADEQKQRLIFDKINEEWKTNNQSGRHRENVNLMRESLKRFPNNALLLVQLSASLEKLDGTDDDKARYLRESIAVQEQIIRYCDDCEVRGATLYNICFAYWKIGEKQRAIEQAKKLPNLYKGRENALVYFLEDSQKREVAKEALTPLAWGITHHLSALAETENDERYLKKAMQIIDILFGEGKDIFIQRMYNSLEDRLTEK